MKRILVIDGQGGRLGRQLVKDIAERWPQCELMAVGTNSIAAENMLKAGAARAATGENAAIVAYDSMERLFYFGPGMGHNAVRLNGKMCLGQSELKAYNIITLGQTKLVFIPLCGERFDWDDR